jgi:hypothetical protein
VSNVTSVVEPERGIEPLTPSLPRKCSTSELLWHQKVSGRRSSNPRPSAWKADALPTELLPLNIVCYEPDHFVLFRIYIIVNRFKWGEQDSNLRRHLPADLQSAPVDRFGISPQKQSPTLKTHIHHSFKSR